MNHSIELIRDGHLWIKRKNPMLDWFSLCEEVLDNLWPDLADTDRALLTISSDPIEGSIHVEVGSFHHHGVNLWLGLEEPVIRTVVSSTAKYIRDVLLLCKGDEFYVHIQPLYTGAD